MTKEQGGADVGFERRGSIAIITLDRPESRNAITVGMALALGRLLETIDADPEVRVAVLTGAGAAFSAGMDLKAFAARPDRSLPMGDKPEWGFAGFVHHPLRKPIIAAVNGVALGGGTELALACDLIVADENAMFGLPEVRLGLVAAGGGLVRLAQQVPVKLALELALTGRSMTAREAKEFGLVNRVSDAGSSLEDALELAECIAAHAPLAVEASKRVLYRTVAMSAALEEAWTLSETESQPVYRSDDAAEGVSAFIEKRAPDWAGR